MPKKSDWHESKDERVVRPKPVVLMKNEQDHDQYGDDQRPSGRGGIRLLGHRIQACQEEWGGKPSSANHWIACRVEAV